jgi:uncharacterized protein (DUF2384 family)
MDVDHIEGLRQGVANHPVVLARVERVIAAALDAFHDPAVPRAWVLRPHPWLEWRSPMATAMTEDGALKVELVVAKLMTSQPT